MVETAAQAAAAAAACHYPPKGHRSGGGVRPLHDFRAYVGAASEAIAVGVMIETKLGVKNAAAIAAAKNVDFIFIGPGDLSLSLETTPGSEPHAKACATVLKACRKARKAVRHLHLRRQGRRREDRRRLRAHHRHRRHHRAR